MIKNLLKLKFLIAFLTKIKNKIFNCLLNGYITCRNQFFVDFSSHGNQRGRESETYLFSTPNVHCNRCKTLCS